jgi:hypothetical protein
MYLKLLICTLLMSISVSGFAQVYGGQNTLKLAASGTQQMTLIESGQLVTNYVLDQHLITMMVKTEAMTLNQTATVQSILDDVLQTESNKLFLVQLNVADLKIESNAAASFEKVAVPFLVRYNGAICRGTATLSLTLSPEEILLDFTAQVPIQELELTVDPKHAAHFSDILTVSVEGGTAAFKY